MFYESNDITITKLLSIIYHSHLYNRVASIYLGLKEFENGDTDSILAILKKLLIKINFDLKKLTAISTDNARVKVRANT